MTWLNNHLPESIVAAIVALGGGALLFRRTIKAGITAWRLYRRASDEVHATQERLADGYQGLTTLTERERDRARQECKELQADLRAATRAKDLRDEMNRQNLAHIRLLKARLKEEKIDFSDIDEAIQKQFESE
jgi:hypothetical protein